LGALGLKDLAARKAAHLSVGQQQRVAVARALLGKPDLIIADEPSSALDDDNQRQFMHLLLEQCQSTGAALMMVSHDLRLGQYFQRHEKVGAI
jgi:putative ABC transport system ATP-binding protein